MAVRATLGPDIALEGYTVQCAQGGEVGTLRPGEMLLLDLTWRALEDVSADLTVFANLAGFVSLTGFVVLAIPVVMHS